MLPSRIQRHFKSRPQALPLKPDFTVILETGLTFALVSVGGMALVEYWDSSDPAQVKDEGYIAGSRGGLMAIGLGLAQGTAGLRRRQILLGTLLWPWALVYGADLLPDADEIKIKAAFLYKFCQYIEWPETAFTSPEAPFLMAILGAEPVASQLQLITRQRSLAGRSIQIIHLLPHQPLPRAHLLFIARAEQERLAAIAKVLQDWPVVLVSESRDGLAAGSLINFVVQDDRLKFDINLVQVVRRKLQFSAQLLAVARQVKQD